MFSRLIVLTWLIECDRPHLRKFLRNFPEIVKVNESFILLVKQVEALLYLLIFASIQHHIKV